VGVGGNKNKGQTGRGRSTAFIWAEQKAGEKTSTTTTREMLTAERSAHSREYSVPESYCYFGSSEKKSGPARQRCEKVLELAAR
jgi:hypothetical protein